MMADCALDLRFGLDLPFPRFVDDVNRETAIHMVTRLDLGQYVPNEIVIINVNAFHFVTGC